MIVVIFKVPSVELLSSSASHNNEIDLLTLRDKLQAIAPVLYAITTEVGESTHLIDQCCDNYILTTRKAAIVLSTF